MTPLFSALHAHHDLQFEGVLVSILHHGGHNAGAGLQGGGALQPGDGRLGAGCALAHDDDVLAAGIL